MFDLAAARAAITAHGPIARVVIAAVAGSSPREVGASMLVWPAGQSGTIGGGALEYQAAARARDMLAKGQSQTLTREALGPSLGQCCGGTVTLLTELFDTNTLPIPRFSPAPQMQALCHLPSHACWRAHVTKADRPHPA